MKNKELYQKSVDILLDAYNKKELQHGNPCGCAVGNLVKSNCDNLVKDTNPGTEHFPFKPDWWFAAAQSFKEEKERGRWTNNDSDYDEDEAYRQIESTGYTIEEIYQIEKAFEDAVEEEDGFDEESSIVGISQIHGLRAALNKLAEIHEMKDDSVKENQTKLESIHNTVYC
jgi:hypothetical protein